ncbi:MAG TPA: fluoride efflux transporter CrcB [Hydrogenobaculum sp.]|nr:fluoride efflux transporter CrcB [Hydrogenobaculum sp.]
MNYLAVLVGGGIGALIRYIFASFVQKHVPNFPLGTFLINVSGAFVIGFLSVYLVETLNAPPSVRLLLITGVLGGYTTFSTFTLEGFGLLAEGQYLKALYYILGTNILGFLFVWLGRIIGERL